MERGANLELRDLFGVVRRVRRPAEYAERWAAGKTKPKGPLDAAGHLIYGERRKQASNPLSAASEFAGEGEGEGVEPK